MTFYYILAVNHKLGQGQTETTEAIEGVLFDLKDYDITIDRDTIAPCGNG